MVYKLTAEQNFGLVIDRDLAMEANAGSGKTRVLTERYLDLITKPVNNGEPYLPSEIAAITFTNKAAAEMKERILDSLQKLISNTSNIHSKNKLEDIRFLMGSAQISTFHKFFNNILRNYADLIDLPYDFTLISKVDHSDLIDEVIEELIAKYETKDPYQSTILLLGPATIAELFQDYLKSVTKVSIISYDVYQKAIFDNHVIMFTTLLECWEYWKESEDKACSLPKNQESVSRIESTFSYKPKTIQDSLKFLEQFLGLYDIKFGNSGLNAIFFKGVEKKLGLKCSIQFLKSLTYIITKQEYQNYANLIDLFSEGYDNLLIRKKALGKIDHNDTMILANELIQNHPDVSTFIRQSYKEIMIDEFQDTSPAQVKVLEPLLSLLVNTEAAAGDEVRNRMFIVGDPKQSIYGFTGADITIFKRFNDAITKHNTDTFTEGNKLQTTRGQLNNLDAQWKGKIPLSITFRSAPAIIGFVNDVFSNYMSGDSDETSVDYLPMAWGRQNLDSNFDNGSVNILVTQDKETGVKHNVADIADYVKFVLAGDGDKRFDGSAYRPKDIVILSKKRTRFKEISDALSKRGIPSKVEGDKKYYVQREVQETIAYLRFLLNSSDNIALATLLTSYYHGLDSNDLLTINYISAELAKEQNLEMLNPTFWDKFSTFCSGYEANYKAKTPETDGVFEKSLKAYNTINLVMPLIQRVSTSELILLIYNNSDVESNVASSDNPEKSLLNIHKLIDNARESQETNFFDLSKFIDTLHLMSVKEEDQQEAPPNDDDAVSIMTVHNSKGLEFDFVIYDVTEKESNNSGKSRPVITNDTITWDSFYRFEKEVPVKVKNGVYSLEKLKQKRVEELESKRISYVACTRAKQRLVIHVDKKEIKERFPAELNDRFGFSINLDELSSRKAPYEINFYHADQKNGTEKITLENELEYITNQDFPRLSEYEEGMIDSYYEFSPLDSEASSDTETETNSHCDSLSESEDESDIKTVEGRNSTSAHLQEGQPNAYAPKPRPLAHIYQSEITSVIGGRVFFPTNLILANDNIEAFINKYILGFHEWDFMKDKKLISSGTKTAKSFLVRRYEEASQPKDLFDFNSEVNYDIHSKLSIPSVAYGNLIHSILENISTFLTKVDGVSVYSLDEERLKNWILANGIKIVVNSSKLDELSAQEQLKSRLEGVVTIISGVVSNHDINTLHLISGNSEEIIFKSMVNNSGATDKVPDILGGKPDLFYIDKEQMEITVYDWKLVSKLPNGQKRPNYEKQLKIYMYLVAHLDEDYSEYAINGKLVYIGTDSLVGNGNKPQHSPNVEINTLEQESSSEIESFFHRTVKNIDQTYYHKSQIEAD